MMEYVTIQCDAFRAHHVKSDVANIASIRPERDVKPGKEIPMGEALGCAHLPDAVLYIKPVNVNISVLSIKCAPDQQQI